MQRTTDKSRKTMMIFLFTLVIWGTVSAVVIGLCLAARLGDQRGGMTASTRPTRSKITLLHPRSSYQQPRRGSANIMRVAGQVSITDSLWLQRHDYRASRRDRDANRVSHTRQSCGSRSPLPIVSYLRFSERESRLARTETAERTSSVPVE